MTPFPLLFHNAMRLLAPALLLAALPVSAQPMVSKVVTHAGDGFQVTDPAAPRLPGADAVLLSWADGNWHLRVLSEGDRADRVDPLVRVRAPTPPAPTPPAPSAAPPAPPVAPTPPARPDVPPVAWASDLFDGAVAYHVAAALAPEADPAALLVRLAEADGFVTVTVEDVAGGGASVGVTFRFDDVADWAAWQRRPETRVLLAPLFAAPGGARTALRAGR